MLISETKLDNTFPKSQFSIDGYRLFRKDRNSFGGGLCCYVNENIARRELENASLGIDIENICLEINLRNRKWLVICIYRPPNQDETLFFQKLGQILQDQTKVYDYFILMGDFNTNPKKQTLDSIS